MRSEQRQAEALELRVAELERLLHLRENVITELADAWASARRLSRDLQRRAEQR